MPGGKRLDGESDAAALEREIAEELAARVLPGTLCPYASFEDEAYGAGDGVRVRIRCYVAELDQEPVPRLRSKSCTGSRTPSTRRMADTAPAVRQILRDLRSRGLIE